MASKLFNKIGVGKKHKSHIEVIPQISAPIDNPQPLLIRDCEEYSLPPDCEPEDSVYCEPADSLNTSSASSALAAPLSASLSTLSSTTSAKDTTDLEPLTSVSNTSSSCVSTVQSDTSYNPDLSCNTAPTHSSNTDSEMTVTPHTDSAANAITMQTIPTNDNTTSEYTDNSHHQDSLGCNLVSGTNTSSGLYMNTSQIQAAKPQYIAGKQRPPVPNITPDIDPRNIEYPAPGNEYESPWDLESEIIEVVKQMKQPLSPLASVSPSAQSSFQLPQQSVSSESSPPSISTCAVSSINQHTRGAGSAEQITGLKVNYDARSGASLHKVKQPSVQRQGLAVTAGQQETASTSNPGVSSVLVEGEWREAKPSLELVASPSSPELPSPPQIISSCLSPAAAKANTATNFIYDNKSNDSEIKAMLRYTEDKSKVPCAQPRASVSTSPLNTADQVYENFKDAKKVPAAVTKYDNEAVYDDPWNVEQVQQQIFDELERKQKVVGGVGGDSRHRRASDDLPNERRKQSASHKQRPTDLPSESGSYKGEDTATRRLLSASSSSASASDKLHKLSPRAVHGTSSIKAPQVPQTAPGQAHANKPVLVVHKTNSNYSNTTERKGSLSSSRSGSIRKTPSTPATDVPECQHRIGLGVNKSLPLTQQPWYHGAIQRNNAEELLRRQPDGSFLIRESSNSPRDKTLSLKNSGFIHIKIVQQPDGTVILGQFSHPFRNIMEMVEYYSRHKVNIKGAEHTYLEIPVVRDR